MEGTQGKSDRYCVAWAKSKADKTTLEVPKITLEMAKSEGWSTKNGSKWITMPELMLRYRAAAFFARLYAPDITLGMLTAEEAIDTTERDVTPLAESKLFAKPVQPAQVVEVEAAEQSPVLVDVAPVTLVDQIEGLIKSSGVNWLEALDVLKRNGITDKDSATPYTADEETLSHAIKFWPSIVKLTKGGAK
jgi:hypothetical protein